MQVYQSQFLPKSDRLAANEAALLKSDLIIAVAAQGSEFDSESISSTFDVKVIAGTDLLTLSAHSDEKGQPRKIVEAVLDSYRDHRKKIESGHAHKKLAILDQELITQSDIVQDLRKELTALIGNHGIPYIDGGETNPLGTTEEQMFESARKQYRQFETQRDQIAIQIKKLIGFKDSELIRYAAGLDLPENQVTYYYTRHREALEKKQLLLAQGLGKDHPDILAAEKSAKVALTNATKEVTSLKAVLGTKLELIKKQVGKMKGMIAQRKSDKEDLDLRQKKYNEAKAAYEEARDNFRNFKVSQQESRVRLKSSPPAFTIHGWEEQ